MQVQLKVNGKPVTIDAPPHTLLVQAIREHLKLTGTHVGCDTAQCGACTVIKDGRAISTGRRKAGSSVRPARRLSSSLPGHSSASILFCLSLVCSQFPRSYTKRLSWTEQMPSNGSETSRCQL